MRPTVVCVEVTGVRRVATTGRDRLERRSARSRRRRGEHAEKTAGCAPDATLRMGLRELGNLSDIIE